MSVENKRQKVSLATLPNQLTTMRLFLSFVLFGTISMGYWRATLVLFASAAVTDWLDGYFARGLGQVSSFGRMYDPLIDKVLVCGAFIFLLAYPKAGVAPWMVTVIVAREFIVTGLRGFLEEQGVSFGADMLGKIKMVLQSAALLWIFVSFDLQWFNGHYAWAPPVRDLLNYSAVIATIVSGLNYVRRAIPYLF